VTTTVERTQQQELASLLRSINSARSVGSDTLVEANGNLRVSVALDSLVETCSLLNHRFGAPLSTMVGLDDRARSGQFRLVYVFSVGRQWVSRGDRGRPGPAAIPIGDARPAGRPPGTSGRSRTSSDSRPKDTPIPADWSSTTTGPKGYTRCARTSTPPCP